MNSEEILKAGLDESLKEVNQDEMENFRPKEVSTMNRSERKSRLKYFKKLFKEHVKRKPSVNIHEEDEEKQVAQTMRLQRWATRYAILAKKVDELELKGNYTGGHEPLPEESQLAEPVQAEDGTEENGDLSDV